MKYTLLAGMLISTGLAQAVSISSFLKLAKNEAKTDREIVEAFDTLNPVDKADGENIIKVVRHVTLSELRKRIAPAPQTAQ